MSDLVAGAWREGLDSTSRKAIEWFEQRRAAGFRLIGSEIEQAKLIDILDSYDKLVGELLTEGDEPVD